MNQSLYAVYLGAGLAIFADLNLWDWRFYAIIVPTIILVNAFNKN